MTSTPWNIVLTNLARQTNQGAWGNFTLNPLITSGAVGVLDPETGSFNALGTIADAQIGSASAADVWAMESSTVRRTQTSIDFKGTYKDPSSGTEVKAGLEVAWAFSEENSIASNGTMVARTTVNNFAPLMLQQYDALLPLAKANGYAPEGSIVQGFGMITEVQVCSGGINVGSYQSDKTFSLTGSVDGINAMTGGGSASAGVKASYKDSTQSSAFESHMWPGGQNTIETTPPNTNIGIIYQFASFHGQLVMPTWIEPLSAFTLVFDNAHGGTYVANLTVTYDIPYVSPTTNSPAVLTKTWGMSLSGGRTAAADPIPLEATNIQVTIHFRFSSQVFYQRFPNPLVTWLNGQKTIDIYGVWSARPHAQVRS